MNLYLFIVFAFVGNVTAFDGKLPLFADKSEILRSNFEAKFAGKINTNIIAEVTTTAIPACVKTEKEFRDAVRKARINGPAYSKVDLCTRILKLSGKFDLDGIDVSSRWLEIRCGLKRGRCTIDGQKRSGFLYGLNANIKLDRIDFINGKSYTPLIFLDSNVEISRSSILKTKGDNGIAHFIGGDVVKIRNFTFIQNYATKIHSIYDLIDIIDIPRVTISDALYKSNQGYVLYVSKAEYFELRDVTFENHTSPDPNNFYSVYMFNTTETNMSNLLFKNQNISSIFYYLGYKHLLTSSVIEGSYQGSSVRSNIVPMWTELTLNGVRFVSNIPRQTGGSIIASCFANVTLDGCYFANNTRPVGSINATTIGIFDYMVDDGSDPTTWKNSSIMCSNTKFCDGYPSNETVVDVRFYKSFDAPTCIASLGC